jgi:DMSO/TMAO reductase YedYZ molybdopterin-dependent catalytic subunit
MKRWLKTFVLMSLPAGPAFAQHHQDDTSVTGSDTVRVLGLVKQVFAISKSQLAGLNVRTRDTAGAKTEASFKGILVKDIILKAGVDMPEHKDQGKYLVVVTAVDGYMASFAYNEIMLAAAGEHAFLVWNENGEDLKQDGPFALEVYSDSKRGPRHVKWVKSIEVRKI